MPYMAHRTLSNIGMVFSSSPLRYILAKTQQITDENMGWMLDRHKNGNGTMDAEGAACAWLRSNEEKWDRWITPPPICDKTNWESVPADHCDAATLTWKFRWVLSVGCGFPPVRRVSTDTLIQTRTVFYT